MKTAKGCLWSASICAVICFSLTSFASDVGRFFRIIETSEQAQAADGDQLEPLIDKEALAAIMKHPTEPHYDLLLPMSGRWVNCQASSAGSAEGAKQERFSSSDRSHFTRTIVFTSDADCKTSVREERKSFECSSLSKESLACHLLKTEKKAGDAPWAVVLQSDAELAASGLKLVLKTDGKSHGKMKNSAIKSRHLDVRLVSERRGESESFKLDFSPAEKTKKSAKN